MVRNSVAPLMDIYIPRGDDPMWRVGDAIVGRHGLALRSTIMIVIKCINIYSAWILLWFKSHLFMQMRNASGGQAIANATFSVCAWARGC